MPCSGVRSLIPLLSALVLGCAAPSGLVDKVDLEGEWRLSASGEPLARVRFVIDESFLLLFDTTVDADALDDPSGSAVLGWHIDEHVEGPDDGCRDGSGVSGCLFREDGELRWYERRFAAVDWTTTLVLEPDGVRESSPLPPVNPLADVPRNDAGRPRSFEVPALFAERIVYRLERVE